MGSFLSRIQGEVSLLPSEWLREMEWEQEMVRNCNFTRITPLRCISLWGCQAKVSRQRRGTLLLMINVAEVALKWEHPTIPKAWAILEWGNLNHLFGTVGVAVDQLCSRITASLHSYEGKHHFHIYSTSSYHPASIVIRPFGRGFLSFKCVTHYVCDITNNSIIALPKELHGTQFRCHFHKARQVVFERCFIDVCRF